MTRAALRSTLDSYLENRRGVESVGDDLMVITGKGLNSIKDPILQETTLDVLTNEYGVQAQVDEFNAGRVIVRKELLGEFINAKSWR